MKCAKARELLAADYIDGEIDEGARGEVERHLAACAACREHADTVRRAAVEPFRDASLERAPESLWAKVRQGIAREEEQGILAALGRAWDSLRGPAFAAASVAAAAVVAVAVFRNPSPAPGRGGAASADSEEIQAYLQEQWAALARDGVNARGGSANGATADGGFAGKYGTLVEEYLM